MQIAVHTLDLQAIFLDRVAMRTTCDEKNIVARRRHARAEISSDCTRRHCCNTHVCTPCEDGFTRRNRSHTSAQKMARHEAGPFMTALRRTISVREAESGPRLPVRGFAAAARSRLSMTS